MAVRWSLKSVERIAAAMKLETRRRSHEPAFQKERYPLAAKPAPARNQVPARGESDGARSSSMAAFLTSLYGGESSLPDCARVAARTLA